MIHLPESSFRPFPKKIFAYNKASRLSGLVQQPDKIVVRFALTIYPYSLGFFPKITLHIDKPFAIHRLIILSYVIFMVYI